MTSSQILTVFGILSELTAFDPRRFVVPLPCTGWKQSGMEAVGPPLAEAGPAGSPGAAADRPGAPTAAGPRATTAPATASAGSHTAVAAARHPPGGGGAQK